MSGQVINEYKIGKTNNIFHRHNTFKTALPDISIRYLCYTSNKDFVEKTMHELYKKYSTDPKHEWFKFRDVDSVIKKLESVAEDFYSDVQELTFNETIKKHWYRELKFIAKSDTEEKIIIGKYNFNTGGIVPLERKDLMLCLKYKYQYEEIEPCLDSTFEIDNSSEASSSFNKIEFKEGWNRSKIQSKSENYVDIFKSKSNKLDKENINIKIEAYCKHILTKGIKKGLPCGRIITSKPINLCYSHSQIKNICKFQYTRGIKKDTICAIKIKGGDYCNPHKYLLRQKDGKDDKEDDKEEENTKDDKEDDKEEEESEEEESEEEESDSDFKECEEIPNCIGKFKNIEENLSFLYKDLCNLGFIRQCSRCQTFYTKNYFIKRGRVCHFCKSEWN
jgi:hypothetical protein